jgi:uncharacterized protein YbjT (DUF2867 family)
VKDLSSYRARYPKRDSVSLNFEDTTTFAAALDGMDSIFLVRPPAISKVGSTLNRLVTEAQKVGVKHIVFSSVVGAESNRLLPHHRVETHLRASGINYTILRPSFFADNIGNTYREDICNDHRIFLPAGNARVAFIDTRDIAAVVALIALDPYPHVGKGYTLTGSTSYSFREVAAILSQTLGFQVNYEAASVAAYVQHLRKQALPLSLIAIQTILHVDLRSGRAARIDPSFESLTGRTSIALEQYIEDNFRFDVWA